MSGKPSIATWATETNFTAPGKAWDATPTKVAPIGDLFIPNVKPPAENMNSLRAADQAEKQALADWAGTIPGLNWQPRITVPAITSGNQIYCAAFDDVNNQWLLGMRGPGSPGTTFVETCTGIGDNLHTLGSATGGTIAGNIPTSILKDPTDAVTYYLAMLNPTVDGIVASMDVSAGSPAWTPVDTQTVADVKLAYFSGHLLAAYGEGVSGGGFTLTCIRNSTNKGSTWATGYTSTKHVSFWNVKAGPNEVLALACQASATPFLAQSTNGTSFTEIALSGLLSTDQPTDLVNLGGSTWLMLVRKTGGTLYFQKSTDGGATWTTVSTLTSAQRRTVVPSTQAFAQPQLAAFGLLVLCMTATTVSTSGAGVDGLQSMFSPDGGVTWYPVAQQFVPFTPASGNNFGLAQSVSQALLFTASTGTGDALQFSEAAGIPLNAIT